MADGSISFAEGLGCKAQDSIEMRRKQMLIPQNPKSSIQCGLEVQSPLTLVHSHAISNTQGNAPSSLQPATEAVNLNSSEAQSPSRGPHQAFFQEGVQVDKPNPKILYNAKGNPYVEGDPNLGYSVEDVKPRRQWMSEINPSQPLKPSETHTGNSKQIPDMEQAARVPVLHQGDSSKSGPSILGEQIPINSVDQSCESDSEGELLEVLAGVVSSSKGVSQTPLKMAVMESSAGLIPSSAPRDGVGLKLNQTLSPKPPDPQGPEVRDKALERDLKGNFQKVLSKSAQKRMKKIAKEQSLSSISRGRNSSVSFCQGSILILPNSAIFILSSG
ncbi:hypothetical protein RHSIM_Rhsim13G0129500 [Rhododendron simsii]|uniref:Uncharacterized protein n=1 Tax=Rhododendron simsii TaxID=118357 RepID=A0A834FXF8_RHOSS|nr:hypothetical protein RHSIM_Rhsim13G0129500 [Rhododendron simsii]